MERKLKIISGIMVKMRNEAEIYQIGVRVVCKGKNKMITDITEVEFCPAKEFKPNFIRSGKGLAKHVMDWIENEISNDFSFNYVNSAYLHKRFLYDKIKSKLPPKLQHNLREMKKNRVFYNITFSGHWPVGTCAVIVARDFESAALLLELSLIEEGLSQKVNKKDLIELDTSRPYAHILNDGQY